MKSLLKLLQTKTLKWRKTGQRLIQVVVWVWGWGAKPQAELRRDTEAMGRVWAGIDLSPHVL